MFYPLLFFVPTKDMSTTCDISKFARKLESLIRGGFLDAYDLPFGRDGTRGGTGGEVRNGLFVIPRFHEGVCSPSDSIALSVIVAQRIRVVIWYVPGVVVPWMLSSLHA